ncbi:DUF4811 domain-containing protein [Lacticaseibacillus saniviri]
MILIILGIAVIALYLSFIMMKSSVVRSILVTIFGAITIVSLLLINMNDVQHYGMKKETVETTKTIYSASPNAQLPMLLKQDVGTSGKHNVYIYKLSAKGKTTHTKADYDIHNRVQTGAAKATITEKKTRYTYKSDFYQTLFMNQNQHELVKQTNTIKVPSNWAVLTTTQAKALGKQLASMKNPDAATKAKMAAAIQAQVTAQIKANPALASKSQELAKAAQAKLQAQVIQDAIKQVKATVK